MDTGLSGHRALVTGGSAGIGLAIAKALAAEQASVAITARGADRLAAAVARIPGSTGLAADLGTAEGAAAILDWVGAVDILVHNVGAYPAGNLATPDADWQTLYTLNVLSGVRLSRMLFPAMLSRGWGRVLFIASDQSVRPDPGSLPYATTKAAQLSLARGMAEMTRGTSVTVNSLLVGPVWTEGAAAFYAQPEGPPGSEAKAFFAASPGATSLVGRYAEPQEIAGIAAFLCSPAASYINGAAIRADGGIIGTML
jgi:NAD(P)-dependent dehydrogenase (short-subunit alcohol dehydrogenase family)